MNIKKIYLAIATCSTFIVAPNVNAAGFQVTNHSASGLGRANAGDAVVADNASVLANNPAAMMLFDSTSISGGGNVVSPTTDVTNATFTNGMGTSELDDANDVSNTSYVPYLYVIHPINSQIAVGLSAYTDFGTNVTFSEEFDSQGNLILPGPTLIADDAVGFFAGTTKVTTFNFSGSVAYRVNDALSVGFSAKGLKGEGEFDRTGSNDYGVDFKGDGWAYGWDLGLVYELNDANRFGLSYKSAIDFTADSSKTSTYVTPPASSVEIDSVDIGLPSIAEFSGYHALTDQFSVQYSVMYIGWESMDNLTFELANGGEYVKDYNWDNSWRFNIGGTYVLNESVTLRTGIAVDRSPIAEENRIISIPDSNRIWYSLGATYALNENASIDLGLTYLDGEKTSVTEEQEALGLTMEADTKTTAWITGLQVNYRF